MQINTSFLRNLKISSSPVKLSQIFENSNGKREDKSTQAFRQKLDSLYLSSDAKRASEAKKSQQVIITASPTIKELSPEQRKEFISGNLSDYRDRIENAADNLEFYKEGISYLQQKMDENKKIASGELTEGQMKELESWKEKLSPEEFSKFKKDYTDFLVKDAGVKLKTYSATLDKYKNDVKDVLNAQLGSANGFVNISKHMYDNKTWEALQSVMGDFLLESSGNSFGLKGSESSTEDVLASINDAVKQLRDLSDRVSESYKNSTGNSLGNYVSGGHFGNAGERIENTLLFNREIGENFDPRLKIAIGGTINIYG